MECLIWEERLSHLEGASSSALCGEPTEKGDGRDSPSGGDFTGCETADCERHAGRRKDGDE